MKYRPHCGGGLAASLSRAVEVAGRAGLLAHLNAAGRRKLDPKDRNIMTGEPLTDSDLHVEPYGGDDARIGWRDVHIVILEGWGAVGYCEGRPE